MHDDRVVVLAVADGRSVLIDLVDGVEVARIEAASSPSDALTTTMIGVDDGVLRLGVEGPLTPPRLLQRERRGPWWCRPLPCGPSARPSATTSAPTTA